jgi:hypothetical protein
MTEFWRKAHERTLRDGSVGQIGPTLVRRENWSRTSQNYSAPSHPRDPFLEKYPEFSKSRRISECFVNPNASCPVCGERVYYYENTHGSRVFFDELGHPWPKHPCTDTRLNGMRSPSRDARKIEARTPQVIDEIQRWQKTNGFNFAVEFRTKYGNAPWPLAVIEKRLKSAGCVFLVLRPIDKSPHRLAYVSCKSLPMCCEEGEIVAFKRGKLSFVDTADLIPKEVAVIRYRSAKAFVDALIGL